MIDIFTIMRSIGALLWYAVVCYSFGELFIPKKSTVYKELHADHETGAADNK